MSNKVRMIEDKLSNECAVQGVKQNVSKGDVWLFNPNNVTIGSAVDRNKKSPSFWPIGQKRLILHEKWKCLMARDIFPLKKGRLWSMGQKDGNFLFWSTVVTFLGLKMRFFETPCMTSLTSL